MATLTCIFFIICLFWMDRGKNDGVSRAVWIPLIWMFFTGTRQLSQWLNLDTSMKTSGMQLEGNPLNACAFLILIIAGVLVLWRRKLDWKELFNQNIWIWLLFIFGAVSIFWSDYPIIAFKRLIKSLGVVIMVMVVLSEKRPYEAFGTILKRLAFLFLPLSVLFIEYYPYLGRSYSRFGRILYNGIATHKNSMGQLCLILGIYFCWNLFFHYRKEINRVNRSYLLLYFLFFPILAWLLYKADSATSLICLAIAICFFIFARFPGIYRRPKRLLIISITIIVLFMVMWLLFGDEIRRNAIILLHRKETLTGRTLIWEYLKSHAENHWVGVGYENFWLGSRLEQFWERFDGPWYQAHNGYLEIYLNLGLIGLVLIACNILSGLLKACKQLFVDFPIGILRLSFIIVVVLYNYTEATFSGAGNMLLIFWLGVISPPLRSSPAAPERWKPNGHKKCQY